MMRLFPTCLLIAATLALASCSAFNIIYNNAPSFVAGEFDDAFDLDAQQRDQLDVDLQRFFLWHRQQELPHYRQFLQRAAQTIADGISAQEFLDLSTELRQSWLRSFARAIEDAGGLAETLTPKQLDHFQRYFRESSEEFDDYLQMSVQQREIFREHRGIKRLEDWFGKFKGLQREEIAKRLQQLPEFYPAWISYREARHRALMDAAGEGLSRERMAYILLSPDTEYARAFEPVRLAYWQAYAQMIEDFSTGLSKAQLRHAVERLDGYTEIVEGLTESN